MSVHITHSERKPFESNDPLHRTYEELNNAFDEYFGYFGGYTLDENAGTVTHHIEGASHPNYVGTDQLRFFILRGDRLVLSTQPERTVGADVKYVAIWVRQSRTS